GEANVGRGAVPIEHKGRRLRTEPLRQRDRPGHRRQDPERGEPGGEREDRPPAGAAAADGPHQRRSPAQGPRIVTIRPGSRAQTLGSYIASACTGGRVKAPAVTARTA